MSDLSYMIWFLATAAVTITVLTVGTLAAAGMLPERERDRRRAEPTGPTGPTEVAPSADHHRSRPVLAESPHHHEHRAA